MPLMPPALVCRSEKWVSPSINAAKTTATPDRIRQILLVGKSESQWFASGLIMIERHCNRLMTLEFKVTAAIPHVTKLIDDGISVNFACGRLLPCRCGGRITPLANAP
jgi:hypothetical protein